ncbi:MAG: hypothetical protein RDU20_19680 [Desulfomonilaceae bacterium]|nr:hypothetical protein [Desulfomonilaceae bacterium]
MVLENNGDLERTENEVTQPRTDNASAGNEGDSETQKGESTAGEFASARDLPRPDTNLPSRPAGEVGELTVTRLGDIELGASLEEIEKINAQDGGPRTPMMSVVHAVIANAGGTISIRELAEKVRRYWNRPFPTSPYTPEEFIYVTAKNSDDIRVNE